MGAELSQFQKNLNEKKMKIIPPLLDCTEIDFSDLRYHDLIESDVEWILSRCGMNLHSLILWEICGSTIMSTVKKHCQNLEKFEFSFSSINEDDFINAFTDMTKLKSLTVKQGSFLYKEPVHISKILNIVQDNVNETLGQFKNLRQFILKEYDIDNNAVMEISKIKSLIELQFISCKVKEGTSFILNLPELESLTLDKMENIDDCIINLPNQSENLKCLNINGCKTVPADALKKISNLINLEELNLGGCEGVDSDVFASIINECAKIKKLDISDCQKITGEALVKISYLKNLQVLDICRTENVNDDVIIEIVNNCKKITNLYIQKCNNVSSLALNELAKLENLEVLQLSDVHNARDEMFKNMYKLRSLECNWCENVTDTGIMRIIKNASNLEHIVLFSSGITSKTLVYAADETKKRTNNIVLRVMVIRHVLEDYESLEHDSGHLIDIQGYYVSDKCYYQ
ncbi:EIN3-binding F-box protein 1-like [Aphidius gifuensis]|uniref:EIN3-binding F-box protein 1-like n=1 Tax=Aphidius gifuensis TaxID=684658 RepID=UPI001CDBFADE|nr:EIN3-binding F-box protein 1-like [Aphidius gifuensis]